MNFRKTKSEKRTWIVAKTAKIESRKVLIILCICLLTANLAILAIPSAEYGTENAAPMKVEKMLTGTMRAR
jgi:hypothetical protein